MDDRSRRGFESGPADDMILAGDIGGTKTDLGLFSWSGGELQPVIVRGFKSREYAGLEPLIQEFMGEDLRKVTRACFGVPCPIEGGGCEAPNLPWVLRAGELQRDLQIPELFLIEIELLQYLQARFGHVSYERVISGPGLFNLYRFLRDSGYGDEPDWLAERMSREDPGSVISRAALAHESELCGKALDLFASIYGAEAGNLTLKAMAAGGLYVGGGIAPKIIEKLREGTFMKAFVDKGRFSRLLARIPVRIILNEKTALYGAARYTTLEGKTNTPVTKG